MIYNLDVLDFLAQLKTDSVDLAFLDPPYNIGVFCKMPESEYLDWCEQWLIEIDRVLVANGAVWICHKDPEMLVELSRIVTRLGRARKNWITWDKWNGGLLNKSLRSDTWGSYWKMVNNPGLRSFAAAAEYLVYHANEGEWTAQCDKERGFIFEPLRAYLDSERKRAGVDKIACNVACGFSATPGGMASRHYFSKSQWQLPTPEHYAALQRLFGDGYLTREYDDLRAEYENLRYTFNNPGRISSVWQIPPASKSPHPTPKPELLLERIIETTSNEGDLILDPFCGSGTTAYVAQYLNRRFVVNDADKKWCNYTRERLCKKRLL